MATKSKAAKKAAKKSKPAAKPREPRAVRTQLAALDIYRLRPNGQPQQIGGMSSATATRHRYYDDAAEALVKIQVKQGDLKAGDVALVCRYGKNAVIAPADYIFIIK